MFSADQKKIKTPPIGAHRSLIQFHQKRCAHRDRIRKISGRVPDLEFLQVQSATASLAHGRFYAVLYDLHMAFAFRAYDHGIFQSAHSMIFIP